MFLRIWIGKHCREYTIQHAKKKIRGTSIDSKFGGVFETFNQRFQDNDFSAIDRLNGTISSLEIQQQKIKAIPTWPWRTGTVRSVFTAIALPLVLMIIQMLVEQAFTR